MAWIISKSLFSPFGLLPSRLYLKLDDVTESVLTPMFEKIFEDAETLFTLDARFQNTYGVACSEQVQILLKALSEEAHARMARYCSKAYIRKKAESMLMHLREIVKVAPIKNKEVLSILDDMRKCDDTMAPNPVVNTAGAWLQRMADATTKQLNSKGSRKEATVHYAFVERFLNNYVVEMVDSELCNTIFHVKQIREALQNVGDASLEPLFKLHYPLLDFAPECKQLKRLMCIVQTDFKLAEPSLLDKPKEGMASSTRRQGKRRAESPPPSSGASKKGRASSSGSQES